MTAEKKKRQRAYNHEYYIKNKDKILAAARKWDAEHRDERNAYRKEYRLKNPGKTAAWQAKYRKGNPEKADAWALMKAHGITIPEREAMIAAQQNLCAVCLEPMTRTPPRHIDRHIDHDHSTGGIRGVLCGHCNRGLGHFRDNPGFLRNAAAYLEWGGAFA